MGVLDGQTALVTGASRGIGRAIALTLGCAGARVIVHYHRDRGAAEAVAKELGTARILQADLGSMKAIDHLFSEVKDTKLNILINNAGIWGPTPLGGTDLAVLEAMLDVNVKGMFWLTQGILPRLQNGGRIVNLSSIAGRLGTAGGRSVYGATKAAVDAFTRNWALELAQRGILVNAVAPGYVETDMTTAFFADENRRQAAVDRSPLGRLGNAQEVADTVLFLCSDGARWITGQSLNVSGGFWI
jgi:NAD(P)-dependent dehydrogenase (short-subunit alcohol dehydrogenase family)